MRVPLTQAAEDARASAAALEARGHQVVRAPLVTAERAPLPKINLAGAQGFLVTSAEGARALADLVGVRTFPVFADSDVTAAALRGLGFRQVFAAKDDAADLAKLVERSITPANGALIYACSTAAPVNLPTMLGNMGFAVRPAPLYTLKRTEKIPAALRAALEAKSIDAALFLSADEARAFVALIQREQLEPLVSSLPTVAASPVVAAPLRALKLGGVTVPGGELDAVFAVLDGKLVDKVEEDRAAREALLRAEAERLRAEEERRATEKAERDRATKELADKQRAEQERIAREKAAAEQAAREKAEQERRAKEAARAKEEADKAERKRLAAEQAAAEKAEKGRLAQERAEQDRVARAQAEKEKAERERLAAEKAAAEKAERDRVAKERAEQERLAREQLARDKAERDRIAAEKAAAEKTERERLAKEKAEQERIAAEKAAAEKAERVRIAKERAEQERLERERLAREKAEQDRVAAEKAAAEKAERDRIAAEKIAAAKTEQERLALEKAERERLERERLALIKAEQDRIAREKAEAERIERERLAQEKAEQERLRQEQLAIERAEQERVARERAEAERIERERLAAEKAERERIETERLTAERVERERIAREKAEAERIERARLAEVRAEQDRVEAERLAAERAARERVAHEKAEAERIERERLARERAEAERIARERAEAEKAAETAERARLAAEAAAREKIERERLAAERAERDRVAADQAAAAKAEKARIAAERAEQLKAEKDAAAERRRIERAEQDAERARINAARAAEKAAAAAATPRRSWGSMLASWVGKTSAPAEETSGPRWDMALGTTPALQTLNTGSLNTAESVKPDLDKAGVREADLEDGTASATIAMPPAAAGPDAKEEPPLLGEHVIEQVPEKETETVTVSTEPKALEDLPEVTAETPASDGKPVTRGGGRAARLLAEDAADQRAHGQRFKYLGHSEPPRDPPRDPPPPEPETTERVTPPPYTAPKRAGGGRPLIIFVVLVIAAAAAVGVGSRLMPRLTSTANNQPAAPSPTIDTPATLQSDITALKARVAVLEQEAVNTVTPEALGAAKQELAQRLSALEGRAGGASDGAVTSMGDSLSSQAKQLAAVSARLATLEAAIGNSARLEDLSKRMNMLEGRSAEANSVLALADRVTSLETSARRTMIEQSTNIALLMAVAQWREAVLAGHSFTLELETAKALAARSGAMTIDDAGFAAAAARGLPTLAELQRRFNPAAAAAMRASAIPDDTAPWYRRILERMLAIVTVRRLDGDAAGTGTAAVLARAEKRLAEGDLPAAVGEMNGLSGAAATAAASWLGDAKARVVAESAASDATTRAVAAVAAAGKIAEPAPAAPNRH